MPLSLDPIRLQPDLLGEALVRMVPDPELRQAVIDAVAAKPASAALEGPVLEQWVRSVSLSGVDVVVALGLGTGLVVDLIRARSKASILVLEPRPAVLKQVLSSRPLRYPDVSVHGDVVRLRARLRALCRFGLRVMLFAPSWARAELAGHVADLEEAIREAHQLTIVGENTRRAFGREWTDMMLDGLSRFAGRVPVNRISGALAGVPGVVVASGPGLDRNIDVLPRLEGRAAICALNSSLAALDSRDIRSNLLVTVESKDILNMVARSSALSRLAFVPGLHSQPALFDLPFHTILPAVTGHRGVASWMSRHACIVPLLVGGSVSCLAFSVLEALGCDPIMLVGLNCALAGDRMYASNTTLQDVRYETTGQGVVRMASNAPLLRMRSGSDNVAVDPRPGTEKTVQAVPGWGGGEVFTMPQLNAYRLWFEERAHALVGRRRLVNATEDGARIKGFEEIGLARACDELPQTLVDVQSRLDAAERAAAPFDARELASGLRAEARSSEKASDLARKAKRSSEKLVALLERGRGRTPEAEREVARLERAETALRTLAQDALLLDEYTGATIEDIRRSAGQITTRDPVEGTRSSLEHSIEIFDEVITTANELVPRLERLAAELEKQGRNTWGSR
jgi:hypothetical protein